MPKEKGRSVNFIHPDHFKPRVKELLSLAGAKSDDKTNDALCNALQFARADYGLTLKSMQRPPKRLITRLENSIRNTRTVLRSIRKCGAYWQDTGFLIEPVGRGIVDVTTIQEMIRHGRSLNLPRDPSISDQELRFSTCDEMVVAINIEPLLRAVVVHARFERKRKPGAQMQSGKRGVIFYAINFFRGHSPDSLKSDPKKRSEFVERFYEAATGIDCESASLDYLIGKVLKNECAEGAEDSKERPADFIASQKQVSAAASKKVLKLRKINRQKNAI
jgi:hypothetical protein